MSERELIVVYGKPGTYESLSETLAERRGGESIDIDRLVVKIGDLAVTSIYEDEVKAYLKHRQTAVLNPETATGIVYEAAEKEDGQPSLVVSGFPYEANQIDTLHELASDSDRSLHFVETTAHNSDALETLTTQSILSHTPEQAAERLSYYRATIHATRIALLQSGILIPRAILTSGDSNLTLHIAETLISQQHNEEHSLAA